MMSLRLFSLINTLFVASLSAEYFNATISGYVSTNQNPFNMVFTELGGTTYGYVTCAGGDCVDILECSTGTVVNVGSISLVNNSRPWGIATIENSGSTYAYVCNGNQNNLSIIDLLPGSGTEIAKVPSNLSTGPFKIDFLPVNGSTFAAVIGNVGPSNFEVFNSLGATATSLGTSTIGNFLGLVDLTAFVNSMNQSFVYITENINSLVCPVELFNSPYSNNQFGQVAVEPVSYGIALGTFTGTTTPYLYVTSTNQEVLTILSAGNGTPTVVGSVSGVSMGNSLSLIKTDDKTVGFMNGFGLSPYATFLSCAPGTASILGSVYVGTPTSGTGVIKTGNINRAFVGLYEANKIAIIDFGFAKYPPISFPPLEGNAKVVADLLIDVNGKCPTDTQNIINYLYEQNVLNQIKDLNQLTPAFRVIQYSLEKLSFSIQNDTSNLLYDNNMSSRIYLDGGYDYLNQQSKGPYTGYRVNSFYQTLGGVKKHNSVKLHAAIGAAESWMNLHPLSAHAYYTTAYGTLGVANLGKKFKAGLSALFGYSFLNTHRNISFLNAKASSSHQALNLNLLSHVSYSFDNKSRRITPYEEFGFVYGREGNYKETGNSCLNFHVKLEKLALIRNTLGLKTQAPVNENIQFFVDIAWVYEYLFDSNSYKARIIDSDFYGAYRQIKPTPNMGQVSAGFITHNNYFNTEIKYLGLFGKGFMDQTGSIKLIKPF